MVTRGNSAIQSNKNINIINYAYQFDRFKFVALNKLLKLSFFAYYANDAIWVIVIRKMSCLSHFRVFLFLGGGGGGKSGGRGVHGFLPTIVGYAGGGGAGKINNSGGCQKLQGEKSKIIIAPPPPST